MECQGIRNRPLSSVSGCPELSWLLQPQLCGSYSNDLWLWTASAKKVTRRHFHKLGWKFSFSKSSCGDFKARAQSQIFRTSHQHCSPLFSSTELIWFCYYFSHIKPFWKLDTHSFSSQQGTILFSQGKYFHSAKTKAENPYYFWSTSLTCFKNFLHNIPVCFVLCFPVPCNPICLLCLCEQTLKGSSDSRIIRIPQEL